MKLQALRDWLWARRETLLFAALVIAAWSVTLYWCFPGFMARDSGTQLEQARAFEFWDDHPVLMALLWHYLDRVVPGPLGMLACMSGLCWAGLGVLFWALPGPLWLRAAACLGAGFFPPFFATLPIVLKDALMHGGLLLGLGFIVLPTRRALVPRLLLSLLCFVLALGTRHNGAAAAWPLLALPLLRAPVWRSKPRWLRLVAASVASLGLTVALLSGLGRALAPISNRTEFWQTVPVFDLAGMSVQLGELLVEPETEVLTTGMGLEQIETLFHIDYGPTLYYCIPFDGRRCVNVFQRSADPEQLRQLTDNWLRAIRQHPGVYLAHRLSFAREMLTVTASSKELYYLDGAPHHDLANDYPPRRRTLRLMARIEQHIRWVGYRPWIYVALSALLLPLELVAYLRGRSALPLLMNLSGVSYLLSTLLAASSTDYRYSVWTILCSVLSLLTLLASFARGPAKCLGDRAIP